ncbi:protein SODIUM POTASSIUM ROOT DEFECTIVE 1-like [Hevea brasiliensis]|uniref:protein SODIUM POTASSIUM ROOT DEFECTIVE 1-like n=1 Tax=Hevea brasiliensis TaxID=3981 RepID=UPI0025DA380B|nr:protein SODIUM POTASSIUM ROOT DEFECTIVE 1-like [Hevea brasiliensis]
MTTKKSGRKMRGFMCQSTAATAVCALNDPRSVIVPRRPERTLQQLLDNPSSSSSSSSRLLLKKSTNNGVEYSRLVESPVSFLPPAAANRSSSLLVSSIKKKEINNHNNSQENRPKPMLQNPTSMASSDQVFQVVVMRVSLHCQGCAGKVKKHLSKMEGVTSFSIDLETKRVTVMGHVSPVGVLESISKVKPAEFWPCS